MGLTGVQNRADGLVGINGTTGGSRTIIRLVAVGDGAAEDGVGGLVGANYGDGRIEGSRATATITAAGVDADRLSAINDGTIRGASARGDVQVRGARGESRGVVASTGGEFWGEIRQCSASGNVTQKGRNLQLGEGNQDIGGLHGERVWEGWQLSKCRKPQGALPVTADASRIDAVQRQFSRVSTGAADRSNACAWTDHTYRVISSHRS